MVTKKRKLKMPVVTLTTPPRMVPPAPMMMLGSPAASSWSDSVEISRPNHSFNRIDTVSMYPGKASIRSLTWLMNSGTSRARKATTRRNATRKTNPVASPLLQPRFSRKWTAGSMATAMKSATNTMKSRFLRRNSR